MFYGLLHMDTPVLTELQKLTFINSVRTLKTVEWTYQEWYLTGTDVESLGNPCYQYTLTMMKILFIGKGTENEFTFTTSPCSYLYFFKEIFFYKLLNLYQGCEIGIDKNIVYVSGNERFLFK